jgi:hypothetical protein
MNTFIIMLVGGLLLLSEVGFGQKKSEGKRFRDSLVLYEKWPDDTAVRFIPANVLKGKRKLLLPPSEVQSKQAGKIVAVAFVIDGNGNVTDARILPGESTTDNPICLAKARQAVMKAKFEKGPSSIPEQHGVYYFRIKEE